MLFSVRKLPWEGGCAGFCVLEHNWGSPELKAWGVKLIRVGAIQGRKAEQA